VPWIMPWCFFEVPLADTDSKDGFGFTKNYVLKLRLEIGKERKISYILNWARLWPEPVQNFRKNNVLLLLLLYSSKMLTIIYFFCGYHDQYINWNKVLEYLVWWLCIEGFINIKLLVEVGMRGELACNQASISFNFRVNY
jgi:hypothetical protein